MDVFVYRTFNCLKPVNMVPYSLFDHAEFLLGKATFQRFFGNILNIPNIQRVNYFFVGLLRHCALSMVVVRVKRHVAYASELHSDAGESPCYRAGVWEPFRLTML